MKVLKSLSLLSLALFPLTSTSVEQAASQPAPAELQCAPAAEENLCGRCGDGYCAKQCGETATSCPKDCGTAY
jgi:hypothetical protein